jgi:hypothetical protein
VPLAAVVPAVVASVVVVASAAFAHPGAHGQAVATKLAHRVQVRRKARPETAAGSIDSIVIPLFVF